MNTAERVDRTNNGSKLEKTFVGRFTLVPLSVMFFAIVLLFDAKFLKTWSVGKEIPGVSRYSLLFMFDNRSLNRR